MTALDQALIELQAHRDRAHMRLMQQLGDLLDAPPSQRDHTAVLDLQVQAQRLRREYCASMRRPCYAVTVEVDSSGNVVLAWGAA